MSYILFTTIITSLWFLTTNSYSYRNHFFLRIAYNYILIAYSSNYSTVGIGIGYEWFKSRILFTTLSIHLWFFTVNSFFIGSVSLRIVDSYILIA